MNGWMDGWREGLKERGVKGKTLRTGEREGEGGRAHSWSGVISVRGLRIIGVRELGFKGFGV